MYAWIGGSSAHAFEAALQLDVTVEAEARLGEAAQPSLEGGLRSERKERRNHRPDYEMISNAKRYPTKIAIMILFS